MKATRQQQKDQLTIAAAFAQMKVMDAIRMGHTARALRASDNLEKIQAKLRKLQSA